MDMFLMILALVIAALLAIIPASIAENKGYSYGLWWLFGWLLFLIALIVALVMPDKNARQIPIYQPTQVPYSPTSNVGQSAVDELKKYKELFDARVITEEEFDAKKKQILGISPANISQASAGSVIKTPVEAETSSSTSDEEGSNEEVYVDPEKRSLEKKQAELNSEIAKQDQIILRARKDKRAEVPSLIESQKLWNQINDLEQRRDRLGVFAISDKKKIDDEISVLDAKRSALNDKAEKEQKERDAEADKKIAPAEVRRANLQKELNKVIMRINEIDNTLAKGQEDKA